jgi:hypothetical protein
MFGIKPSCGFLGALILWLASCATLAAERSWIEVDSPHFRVMSDGSERDARRIAYEFEQMRAVLANRFPGARIETGAPFLVLAASDERTAMELIPGLRYQCRRDLSSWLGKAVRDGAGRSRHTR